MYINKVIGLQSANSGKPTNKDKATSTTTTPSTGGGMSSGSEGEDRYRPDSTNTEYKPLPGDVYYIPPVVTKNQNSNPIIENIKPIAIGLIIAKILHII
jgi:hypothetical protein